MALHSLYHRLVTIPLIGVKMQERVVMRHLAGDNGHKIMDVQISEEENPQSVVEC